MSGNPLVRFDEGGVGRTAKCRPLSYSTVRLFFQAINNARDAVFDQRHVKVDEQAQPLVREAEIGQKLLLVNRSENLDGFHFYDHFVLDDQVGPKSGVDADGRVDHWNRLLAHRAKTPAAQFIGQDRVVNRFE